MKKPEYQWQTRLHRARRRDRVPPGAWDGDPRAEAFDLEFDDGRRGEAVLGLRAQWVDAVGAADPDLPHAVRCWLAARGVRELALDAAARELRGSFTMEDLGDRAGPRAGRLITLAPSNAEIVDALGAFDRVVACEDSSDHPPQVQSRPRLGPDLGPDLDRVAELAPDWVVSSLSVPGMERVVTGLRARGIRQLVLAPRSIDEVMSDITRVGLAIACEGAARNTVSGMQAERETLVATRPEVPVRVYLEWWPKPMFTPGAECFSNELMFLAGGVNVFASRPGSSVQITPEELVAADPQVCFVSWCGVRADKLDPTNLSGRPGLEALGAARAGHVAALDEQYSGRPGPRMLEAAKRMRAAISQFGLV